MCKEYIPYQKCPICEGTGGIHQYMTLERKDCDVCNGKKIIPMHPTEEIKQTEQFDVNKVICECGGELIWDGYTRTSIPPKYAYECNQCNNVKYLPFSDHGKINI